MTEAASRNEFRLMPGEPFGITAIGFAIDATANAPTVGTFEFCGSDLLAVAFGETGIACAGIG